MKSFTIWTARRAAILYTILVQRLVIIDNYMRIGALH